MYKGFLIYIEDAQGRQVCGLDSKSAHDIAVRHAEADGAFRIKLPAALTIRLVPYTEPEIGHIARLARKVREWYILRRQLRRLHNAENSRNSDH